MGTGGASKAIQYALNIKKINFDIASRQKNIKYKSYKKINESCENLYQFINDLNPYTLKEDYKVGGVAENEWNIPKLLNHKQGEMLFEHLGFIRRSVFINKDSLWDLKKLKDCLASRKKMLLKL